MAMGPGVMPGFFITTNPHRRRCLDPIDQSGSCSAILALV